MARVQFGTEDAAGGARERSRTYVPVPSLSARPGSPVQLLRKLFLRIDRGDIIKEKTVDVYKRIFTSKPGNRTTEQLNKQGTDLERLSKLQSRTNYSEPFNALKNILDPRQDSLTNIPYRVIDLTKMFLERKNEPTK